MLEPHGGGLDDRRIGQGRSAMSIYGRRKGVMDFDRVPGAAETPAASDSATRSRNSDAGNDEFVPMRRSQPMEQLLPVAEQWLNRLPPNVSANALTTQFPRIANFLATQWVDRQACARYFDELLADRRGGRRGFPPAVHHDLVTLRDFWYSGR